MCYQVIERYSVCKCLYYKHAIDSCSRHGEREHHVQEKTVLVGYACSSHSIDSGSRYGKRGHLTQEKTVPVGYAHSSHGISRVQKQDIQDTEGILDRISDHSDDSEDDGSICSTAITTSSATSFIAANGEDTIEEIIQTLIQDPLLGWTKLLQLQGAEDRPSGMKDIRFFLRAFESDLRETADSALELHACASFRSRIGYISSRICEHFNLKENDDQNLDLTGSGAIKTADAMPPKTLEELDPTNIPAFGGIRSFMFDGVPFSALKQNIRNYARNTRNYVREMNDILTKNIRPVDANAMALALEHDVANDFGWIMKIFFLDLLQEAINSKTSAANTKGISSLEMDSWTIAAHVGSYWGTTKPTWHYYPLVLGKGSKLQAGALKVDLEYNMEYEAFESFVCSSSAFSDLTAAISKYATRNGAQQSRLLSGFKYSRLCSAFKPTQRELKIAPPGYTGVWFTCSCGKEIYDEYADLMPGGARKKQEQLEVMSVRRKYYEAATSNTETRGMMDIFKGLFASFIAPTEGASLPQQQRGSSNAGLKSQNICTTHLHSDPDGHRYIHWCMPWTRYAMRMHPLQTCQIYSDFDFFTALKARYGNSKSRLRHFLSLKKPIALRFVKFQLYHKRLVDIHEAGIIPPESRKDEYEYSPMPAETIPPIGSNLLMHFFTHPEDAAPCPVLLPCIPKRKRDKLEPCPIRGSSVGWGIDITTGTDQLKLFYLGLLACVGSLLFGVIWTIKMRDIQGGFGAAGFMFALLGFAIASLKALDF